MVNAVYIHIPFCKSICTYCDFCKFLYNKNWSMNYLKKLKEEILSRYMNEEIKTIYIGGGTPSALDNDELEQLFDIVKIFKVSSDIEFTFECNIEDINEQLIKMLVQNGVNRVSIGIESFNKENLILMNRMTDFDTVKNKLILIRKYGIDNINLDLMYAIPNETLSVVKKDLKLVLKLKPTHISTYSLILENNTFLAVKKTPLIKDELDCKMYNYITKKLTKKGYNHYEISNFSLLNKESIHNSTYWLNKEYYGFGCGACGYVAGVRYDNTRSLTKYIESNIFSKKELLSKNDIMDYHIILGLRMLKGINVQEFNDLYNVDIFERYPIKGLIKYNDMFYENGYVFINKDKLYVMNEILNKLV